MEMTENIQNFFETLSAMEQHPDDRKIGIFSFYEDRTLLEVIQQMEKKVTIYLGQYVDPKSILSKGTYFEALKNQNIESIVEIGPLSENEFQTIVNIYLQKYTVISSSNNSSLIGASVIFNDVAFQPETKQSLFVCQNEPSIFGFSKIFNFSPLLKRNQGILNSFTNGVSRRDYIQSAYQKSYQDYFAELYETVKKPYQLEIKRQGK